MAQATLGDDIVFAPIRDLADQLFAMPIAIRQSGVDEVQPQLNGVAERVERLAVFVPCPQLSTDSPGTIADLAYLESRSTQFAIAHDITIIET